MTPILNYIDGELCEPTSGGWLDVFNPATGEVYGQVADSTREDVARAVTAAQAAFPAWQRLSPEDRGQLLQRVAERIEQQLESLARDESMDNGKPLSLARSVDIPRAARNLRFFAAAGTTLPARHTPKRPASTTRSVPPWAWWGASLPGIFRSTC